MTVVTKDDFFNNLLDYEENELSVTIIDEPHLTAAWNTYLVSAVYMQREYDKWVASFDAETPDNTTVQ